MLNFSDPRLIQLTDAANARMAEIKKAFGLSENLQVHPGIVAVVLDVAGADAPQQSDKKLTAGEDRPSEGEEDDNPPQAPAKTDEEIKPLGLISSKPNNVQLLERTKKVLRDIAVDGQMPTMREFNDKRPAGFPTANHITQRTFVRWGDLARELDLHMNKGRRSRAKPAARKQAAPGHRKPRTDANSAPSHRTPSTASRHTDPDARRRQLEDIIFHLRDMAVDGKLPAKEAWDANKPAELPDAGGILLRYGLVEWDDLAGYTKLEPRSKRKPRPIAPPNEGSSFRPNRD